MSPSPKILVIRRRYLGDIVLLGSFLRNLRLQWPAARLCVLVEPAYAEILALNPDVDATLTTPRAAGDWPRFIRAVRAEGFTHVFNFDNTEKTALITRLSGAPFRLALHHGGYPVKLRLAYTHVVNHPNEVHEASPITEYYLAALPAAGVPVATREVRLVPRAPDVADCRRFVGAGGPVLLVHPGSRSPWRIWPADRFAAVCDRVQDELGAQVVLVGGPGERALVAEIRQLAKMHLLAIEPPPGLARLAALAQLSAAVLCHDSGPMHVAAAVGTPVVALYGSQNPVLFQPMGPGHILLTPALPCGAACVAPGRCIPADSYHSACVRRHSVADVFAAVPLAPDPPGPDRRMTNPAPLVTFAIPAYDRPELLAEALASLAAQTDPSFDVVVCDDLARDATRRIVEKFPAERFSYVAHAGAPGAVANWNRCLRAGRGAWVTVLHEDDTLFPWYLASVLPHLVGGNVAVAVKTVQGPAPVALGAPPAPGQCGVLTYRPRFFLKSSMTPFPGVMVRREAALRLGGFDERWGPLADYEFWYRLACAGPVLRLGCVGAFYRVAPGQWTERAWTRMLPLSHLLRLRIAREQFGDSPRWGQWLARFFSHRQAQAYARRFAERPAALARGLALGRIPLAGLPSGWAWQLLKLTA